jgi:glycosyltransferase involved in cell wall biosynthesis
VILPNFNYARYLKERVHSILNQSMADLELIYIDDASTDASNRVMEPFAADPRVRMVLHTQNSGRVYQRWHEAALLATGDWLWFAGADDTAHPRFLETLLESGHSHPNAALLHCNIAWIDADSRLSRIHTFVRDDLARHLSRDYVAPGHEEVARMIHGPYLSTASALLLRRDAYLANGGWDNRLWKNADWDLYNTILRDHDVVYTARHLASYRLHARTVSHTTRYIVAGLEDAYCVAHACSWMNADPRCTPQTRAAVRRKLRSMVHDLFADPTATVPANLRFAAEEIHAHVPDKRLLRIA